MADRIEDPAHPDDRPPPKARRLDRHRPDHRRAEDRVEPTWPHFDEGEDRPVSELAGELQGADPPFGTDLHPPLPLERHGRFWSFRPPGSERRDSDFGPDEAP